MPVARVDADGAVVLAGQDPDGAGVLVQVTTRDATEAAALVITVDGRITGRSPRQRSPAKTPGRMPLRPVPGRDETLPSDRDREGD